MEAQKLIEFISTVLKGFLVVGAVLSQIKQAPNQMGHVEPAPIGIHRRTNVF